MSILIKGLKMPEDCPQCPLSHWNKLDQLTGCELVRRYVPESESSYWQSDKRPEWCPLVELPDHGDLIDRDALMPKVEEKGLRLMAIGIEKIVNAPTVIPAERSVDKDKDVICKSAEKSEEECEDENWYTELDDPKIAERNEE